jgi:hypothetical protein
MKNMWYSYPMGYYSALKKDERLDELEIIKWNKSDTEKQMQHDLIEV